MPTKSPAGEAVLNVLFLCTGNSARSILAESLIDRIGAGRFKGYSAGSHPTGRVNPHAIELLRRHGHPVDDLRSKSWDEFTTDGAPTFDFVFTVCDNAAGEVCPVWLGQPMTAHWGFPDPAAATGSESEIAAAFADVYRDLAKRIEAFVDLPLDSLDRETLARRLRDMG